MDHHAAVDLQPGSTCLLLGSDLQLIRELRSYMDGLQISSVICLDPLAFPRMLSHGRYECVVVDCHIGDHAFTAIESVRTSPSNHRSVVVAIAGTAEHVKKAFLAGANFTLDVPLSPENVEHLLRAAHQIMENERRRYMRRACCVAACLEAAGEPPNHCHTLNIAEGGVCVLTDRPLAIGKRFTISFRLQGGTSQLRAECQVCWTDEQGRVGLEFLFMPPDSKDELQQWLSRSLGAPEAGGRSLHQFTAATR